MQIFRVLIYWILFLGWSWVALCSKFNQDAILLGALIFCVITSIETIVFLAQDDAKDKIPSLDLSLYQACLLGGIKKCQLNSLTKIPLKQHFQN